MKAKVWMPHMEYILLISGLAAGFYMAWSIGANDLANAMGTIYGSGSMKFRDIIIIAAPLNMAGAVFFGTRVIDTIGRGLVTYISPLAAFSGLLAAAIFLTLATYFRMPVSTTHSIIGAILGYGLIEMGIEGVNWGTIFIVVSSWIISPLAGIAMGFLIHKFIQRFGLNKIKDISKEERLYFILLVAGAGYESFANGSNDLANAVALVGVILVNGIEAGEEFLVPEWVILFGGIGMVVGLITFGERVMETIGRRITRLNNPRAYSAEFSAATIVLICSYLGLPVSTTHASIGTVSGVGYARGREEVNPKTLGKIIISWGLTLPAAGGICGAIHLMLGAVI